MQQAGERERKLRADGVERLLSTVAVKQLAVREPKGMMELDTGRATAHCDLEMTNRDCELAAPKCLASKERVGFDVARLGRKNSPKQRCRRFELPFVDLAARAV